MNKYVFFLICGAALALMYGIYISYHAFGVLGILTISFCIFLLLFCKELYKEVLANG